MKSLIINTKDTGGAARACLRLHQGLLALGQDTHLLLKEKKADVITACTVASHTGVCPGEARRVGELIRRVPGKLASRRRSKETKRLASLRPPGTERTSLPETACRIEHSDFVKCVDVINLHWVSDFLNWPTFFKNIEKPIIWTLHDEYPFLGIEHYREVFLGPDAHGNPLLRTYTAKELEEAKRYLERKHDSLKNVKNLTVVGPSRWIMEESASSELFKGYSHSNIPYGCPSDIYRPINQKVCREILRIPTDKKVLLFVAEDVQSVRKGFAYLQRAIEQLDPILKKELMLVSVGKTTDNDKEGYIQLGYVSDERLMALAYNAADFFVIPSLLDNLPNTIIESQMCGTPVVGFPSGGVSEMIRDDKDGVLCEKVSVSALVRGITRAFEEVKKFDRVAISAFATEKYSMTRQAQAYIDLYTSVYNTL